MSKNDRRSFDLSRSALFSGAGMVMNFMPLSSPMEQRVSDEGGLAEDLEALELDSRNALTQIIAPSSSPDE